MKKISLLLVGVLALFSCEQEELDNFVESSGVGQVMTRAIGSSADFDPISELAEIPVNILNIGNSKQKYLTCKEKGTEICLTNKNDTTDEEIKKAAEIAQATEFIEAKDDKYESAIAQGGSNVSGGQKQRLAIARAIAKDPKIFIFDDSFSALDLKTDAALRKALAENVKDSTVIIVAQRISTILHAEQILVLDDGKIVGKGTHEELLKSCEVYRQIAKSQLSAKELGLEESEVALNE